MNIPHYYYIITATFSRCLVVTSSCKGTITQLLSKLVKLQALSSALTSLRRHITGPLGYKFVDPSVLKFNYVLFSCSVGQYTSIFS